MEDISRLTLALAEYLSRSHAPPDVSHDDRLRRVVAVVERESAGRIDSLLTDFYRINLELTEVRLKVERMEDREDVSKSDVHSIVWRQLGRVGGIVAGFVAITGGVAALLFDVIG